MTDNQLTNIQVYRKKWNVNIGIIIFGVIFIYLVVTVLTYVTAKHVSVYEVREGSILKDNAYTGIILRQEEIVNTEADGYINYFATEGSKVGKKTSVYSISPQELEFASASSADNPEEGAGNTSSLTSEEQNSVALKAQSFSEGFQDGQFADTYNLKSSIGSIISSNSAQSRQAQLDAMIQSGQEGLNVYGAVDDGVIIYSTDGYESLTMDQITEDMISRADYQKKELFNNSKVKAGEPAYKLITSEEWTLVIELDDKMAKELADTKSVKVRFSKDNETTWASFSIYNTENSNLGFLSFDHSMVRYAGERFLDIELILEDESGLKIPKSAVTKKDFYLVPEDYLTQGGNSKETGVLVDGGKDSAVFKRVEVYYRDNDTGMVYLDPNDFEKGDTLIKPDSNDTYPLSDKDSLSGVFNINKGYAVFRQIHILCESDEYYIVESGNDYGLSNYDHIALDGSTIHENDVVF